MRKALLMLTLCVPTLAFAQNAPEPESADEIAAKAAIAIGRLQTQVGQLTLENIELKRKAAAAAAKTSAPSTPDASAAAKLKAAP